MFSADKIHTRHQQAFFILQAWIKSLAFFFFVYCFLQRKTALKIAINGPMSHKGKYTGPTMPSTIWKMLKIKIQRTVKAKEIWGLQEGGYCLGNDMVSLLALELLPEPELPPQLLRSRRGQDDVCLQHFCAVLLLGTRQGVRLCRFYLRFEYHPSLACSGGRAMG